MILLLKRRDLPRKLARMNTNVLSFKVCNEIKFKVSIDEKDISFELLEKS